MKTVGAIQKAVDDVKEVYNPTLKESGEFENRLTFGEDTKEVIDLKQVEPNNKFYDTPTSKEKEPITKPTQKVKKKK